MEKLITLVKLSGDVSAEAFADYWRERFLPEFRQLASCRDHLVKAVHHHAVPVSLREDEGLTPNAWAGAGTYYFDRDDIRPLFADPEFKALYARHRHVIGEATHLIVNEIWMYNRDTSHLPVKMFAFFKRKPHLTRAQVQDYYFNEHAAVGASINKNRTVRYIQNHVLEDYTNPDAAYDFDAGPEIWFKSIEVANDLFTDTEAMEILGRDEETFCLRSESVHFLTDEVVVFEAEKAVV